MVSTACARPPRIKIKTPTQGRGLVRQNTLPVIGQQVRAQTPPDHAGIGYDDGDASARTCSSCWAVFYDGRMIESRGSCVFVEVVL